MKFELIQELKESTLIRSESYFERYTLRDILDYTFLYLLVLEILRQEPEYKNEIQKYAQETLRYGSDFKFYKKSGTDLYNFLHMTLNPGSVENLKDYDEKLAKRINPDKQDFLYYLNGIRYDRDVNKATINRWLLKLETQLIITESEYRSIRRLIREWEDLNYTAKNTVINKLTKIFRTDLRLSDIKKILDNYATKFQYLTETTVNELNWAVGADIEHARGLAMRDMLDPKNKVIWIDIEKLMEHVEKDFRMDLEDPLGGPNKIGFRVPEAKTFFIKGGYMEPSYISVYDNKVHFTDGRHRLVAAYQLGARYAPVIVAEEQIPELRKLGVIASSRLQETKENINHIQKAFIELGDMQRGDPEQAMLKVQRLMGGGVLNPVVEHVGDLTHRMTTLIGYEWGNAGYDMVYDKVYKGLKYLTHPYGFEKEMQENIINNAEYRNQSPEELKSNLNKALLKYANEHSKLPVYNEAQYHAREAAVHIGKQQWVIVEYHLRQLEKHLDTKEEWNNYASQYQLDKDGHLMRYPYNLNEYKYANHDIKSLGVPREEMPQIEWDQQEKFLEYLESEGISYEMKRIPVKHLKPTQDEYDPDKIKKPEESKKTRPLIVSMDNYIIDGHHRWTAFIINEPDEYIKAFKIYMPIKKLLDVVRNFSGAEYEKLEEIRRVGPMRDFSPEVSDVQGKAIKLNCGHNLIVPANLEQQMRNRFVIKTDEGLIVGSLNVMLQGNTLQIRMVRMNPDHYKKGCMTEAYLELLNLGFEILSDSEHTPGSEKLWKRLFNKADLYLAKIPYPGSETKKIENKNEIELAYETNNDWDLLLAKKKKIGEAGVGKIVKGVNTTVDVGPDETKKQAKKFGFELDKNNEPPKLYEKIDPEKTVNKYFEPLYYRLVHDRFSHMIGDNMTGYADNWPKIIGGNWLLFKNYIQKLIEHVAENIDPTPNHEYTLWIIQKYIKGGIESWEDMIRVNEYLEIFNKVKKKQKFKAKYSSDINQYKTLNDLGDAVLEFREQATTKRGEEEELLKKNEAEIIYDNEDIKVVIPKTLRASCFYGRNTQWCTASDKAQTIFNSYSSKGPLYIILIKKENKRYQFHFPSHQYMNENDRLINQITFLQKYPELIDLFSQVKYHGKDKWQMTIGNSEAWFDNEGKYHRDDGPALIEPSQEQWYEHGELRRKDGPAEINYQEKSLTYYGKNYTRHREDGPAVITPYVLRWFYRGQQHREDGPSEVTIGNNNYWNHYNKFYREEGPAVIDNPVNPIGNPIEAELKWFIDDELHRKNGPAYININPRGFDNEEAEGWFKNGKRHREDGPALIRANGSMEWYINGEEPKSGPIKLFSSGMLEYNENGIFFAGKHIHDVKTRKKNLKKYSHFNDPQKRIDEYEKWIKKENGFVYFEEEYNKWMEVEFKRDPSLRQKFKKYGRN